MINKSCLLCSFRVASTAMWLVCWGRCLLSACITTPSTLHTEKSRARMTTTRGLASHKYWQSVSSAMFWFLPFHLFWHIDLFPCLILKVLWIVVQPLSPVLCRTTPGVWRCCCCSLTLVLWSCMVSSLSPPSKHWRQTKTHEPKPL